MHFALVAQDRPGHVARRLALRPEHLKYLEDLGKTLVFAGPFLSDAGEGVGTIAVVEADTLDAAKAIFARDPFARENLFDSVTIKPWRITINNSK